MAKLITDQHMRDQVHQALGDEAAYFNVTGIVAEIQRIYGTVDIDTIIPEDFWLIVSRNYIDAY